MSWEMSMCSWAPRCTPPMPPVAKTRMPAAAASSQVELTVVPPEAFWATATARSREPSFSSFSLPSASRRRAASSSPSHTSPSTTAMGAGTAPARRTASSQARAAARLSGYGRPCATTLVSSATSGAFVSSARRTSSE